MVRNMAKSVTPGYVVVYPNRDKASSKLTKLLVVLLLLVSVGLMLLITLGGWSKLQGLKAIDFLWCIAYLVLAFYVGVRWSRGALTMAAALAILLLIIAVIAATGVASTSWFDRHSIGFASAKSVFGSKAFGSDVLGSLTVLLIPVQAALIVVATIAFSQSWNIETEVPESEANQRGRRSGSKSSTAEPATA
jgi:signal transduction histidine kinase